MNFREISTRALYLLFTLGSLGAGIWLLVDPVGSNAALHIQSGDTANGALIDPLLRKLGAAYLCTSLAFLWCLRRADVRKTIQPVLVLFSASLPPLNWPNWPPPQALARVACHRPAGTAAANHPGADAGAAAGHAVDAIDEVVRW